MASKRSASECVRQHRRVDAKMLERPNDRPVLGVYNGEQDVAAVHGCRVALRKRDSPLKRRLQ